MKKTYTTIEPPDYEQLTEIHNPHFHTYRHTLDTWHASTTPKPAFCKLEFTTLTTNQYIFIYVHARTCVTSQLSPCQSISTFQTYVIFI